MADIAIVGAGMMGTATAYPLTDNGHSVRLVGTHLDKDIIKRMKKLEELKQLGLISEDEYNEKRKELISNL